ncbi:RICIN domain-containing protein [Lentzea sp. NPDC058436]|uniref:MGH1-like glycoside hydrolase domain-containing protein n=1 Tax=Lentzea sp. NPDC058436 TaxID=3346499 RepID=UPI00364EC48F
MAKRRLLALILAAVSVVGVAPGTAPAAVEPRSVAPGDLLDHDALLAEVSGGRSWFKANIPFLELPDRDIQRVYYYRYDTLRRALKTTRPGTGTVINEFQPPVAWSARYGGISLNPWHNNRDGRWLHDRRYLDDDTAYWINGVGTAENQNYTGPMADSVWQRYLATGDRDFLLRQLPGLVSYYRKLESRRFTQGLGLYWEIPLADGTEFTIGSYQTKDPFAGGTAYRPTVSSYQFGDATAIAAIARLAGDTPLAEEFEGKARALKAAVQGTLWDPARGFFYSRMKDNAAQEYGQHPDGGPRDPGLPILPEGTLLDGRELTGFVPWMVGLPDDTPAYAAAWRQLMDTNGFNTPNGPSTAERRHRLFNFQASTGCCRWTGPHWPMGTSQTLVAMDRLLHDYTANNAVTRADFHTVLKKYTSAQFKNGRPYVAEAADSLTNRWIYDAPDHSEHYNHSGYTDHVIGGLLGLRPQTGDTLVVDPMIPSSWDWFALENVPYHGHDVSVVWDRTGSKYGRGAGLRVRVDGTEVASAPDVRKLTVPVGARRVGGYQPEVNLAANPFDDREDVPSHAFPVATASFTSPHDRAVRAVDGSIWFDAAGSGPNSRWTNFGSPNASDWLQVDFGRPTSINQLRLHFYDDTGSGAVRVPASYQVEHWNGAWASVPDQRRGPTSANDVTTVDFGRVTTTRVRVVMTHRPGQAVGLAEVEAFDRGTAQVLPTAPVRLANNSTGKCLTVLDSDTGNGAVIGQQACGDGANQKFSFVATDSGYHRLVAVHSGKVVDIAGGGVADEAKTIQWEYLGAANQQWRAIPMGYGAWSLVARHSSKALDVPGCRADERLQLQQWTNFGNDCQTFTLR